MKVPNKTPDQAKYDIRLHALDIADLLRSRLDDAEVLLTLRFGVDANGAVAYSNEHWQLVPSRLPEALNDRRLLMQPEHAWAVGGMATVHKFTYKGSPEPVCVVWTAEDAKAASAGTDAMGLACNEARAKTPQQYGARAVAWHPAAKGHCKWHWMPKMPVRSSSIQVHCRRSPSSFGLARWHGQTRPSTPWWLTIT